MTALEFPPSLTLTLVLETARRFLRAAGVVYSSGGKRELQGAAKVSTVTTYAQYLFIFM
jgi:hypothetical protein